VERAKQPVEAKAAAAQRNPEALIGNKECFGKANGTEGPYQRQTLPKSLENRGIAALCSVKAQSGTLFTG